MSVLINMDMPTSCSVCPLRADVELDEICSQTGEYVCRYDRADDCPLVPVPPHGRLIDADALVRDNGIKEIPEYYEVVCDAPTIIEAEEGE